MRYSAAILPACLLEAVRMHGLVRAEDIPALARKLVKGYHGYIMNKLSHALRAPGTNGKYQDSLHLVLCQKLQIIPLCLQLPEAVA